MSLDLGLVARLQVWRRGRAVPIASCRRVTLSPAARLLCPLQLAGEDATLHALAWGAPGQPLEFRFVPDPRGRDDQHALFAWLGETLDTWMREAVAKGELPQLWLPSGAALTLLDVLADRLRGQREGEPGHLLQQRLTLLLRQSHLEGSQAVILATEAITAHWATGQQPGEDGHLGSLLVWLDPPEDRPLSEALAAAERVPMSTKTRPELDREVLEPAIRAWGRARRAGDASRMQEEEGRIEAALRGAVAPIYVAAQRTIAVLQQSGLPELPALGDLVQRDLGSLQAALDPPEPDEGKKKAHPVGGAAMALVKAEDALEQHAAALVHGDEVALAAARARGDAVSVRLESVHIEKRGRAIDCRVCARTTQVVTRVRLGDTVTLRGWPSFTFKVSAVQGGGGATAFTLEMGAGKRRAGELVEGAIGVLVPPPPNLSAVAGTLKQMGLRLAELPWTHADHLPAPRPDPSVPDDPLADVEALRGEESA